jgi:predicted aspartyl protease
MSTQVPARALLAGLLVLAAGAAAQPAPPAPPPPQPHRPVAPAEFDNGLAIGGEDIAARQVNTRMTVAVNVEGRGPYRFVVDSGADTSVIGTRLARSLALPPTTPVMLHGMTASGAVDRVLIDRLDLGQSTIRDLKMPVLREVDLGGDGMLGIDALVSQRLMMDFDKRVITIEDARTPPPKRLDGEIVVVARRRRGQLILTQASVDRHPIEAVIDTGSEISIGNSLLRAKLSRYYADKLETAEMIGVTGVVAKIDLIRVPELRIGPVLLRDVPIAFADVPPFKVFGLDKQPALLLGTDMMATFRKVSLDFRARKVRFQLRRCTTQGIFVNTSTLNPTRSRLSWQDPGGMACA